MVIKSIPWNGSLLISQRNPKEPYPYYIGKLRLTFFYDWLNIVVLQTPYINQKLICVQPTMLKLIFIHGMIEMVSGMNERREELTC